VVDTALGIAIFTPFSFGISRSLSTIFKGGEFLIPWSGILIQAVVVFGILGLLLKTKGTTPGKFILGLKVVSSSDQSLLSWRQAFGRLLVPYLNLVLGAIPLAIAFFNKERRQLADLICGTRVIQASPRGPVKVRWLIGGLFILNGLWYIYHLPERAKPFSIGPEGILLKFPAVPTKADTSKIPGAPVIAVTDLRCFQLQFRADTNNSADDKRSKIAKAMQIIETRLHELGATNIGVSQPVNTNDTLFVKVSSSAKNVGSLISKRGMLAMRAVDYSLPYSEIKNLVSKLSSEHPAELKSSENYETYFEALNRFAAGAIPKGRMIMMFSLSSLPKREENPYLVLTDVVFDSSAIVSVELKESPQDGSQVFVQLGPEGASKFEQFTGANIGNQSVIEIDNEVNMAPIINGKVSGGLLQLHSGFGSAAETREKAEYLKALLFAGPLPLAVAQTREVECKD
jgi:uncharacterized RDD family membrane protein YckC